MDKTEIAIFNKFYNKCYSTIKLFDEANDGKGMGFVKYDYIAEEIIGVNCKLKLFDLMFGKFITENRTWAYGGPFFVDCWFQLLDEIIDNLKYFEYSEEMKQLLIDNFKYLKADTYDEKCSDIIIWIQSLAYSKFCKFIIEQRRRTKNDRKRISTIR